MRRILIVDDSKTFGSLLRRTIEREVGRPCDWVQSFEQCLKVLDSAGEPYAAALLDLNLPDAPHGEVVDLVLSRGVASIVFSGEMSTELRERMWSRRIVDYVPKQSLHNVGYVVRLLRRLLRNQGLKALVVDDSGTARSHAAQLLAAHGYAVLEAENGAGALERLHQEPDIRLVVTDYAMPGMDGAALTRAIRDSFGHKSIAVIGVSGSSEVETSVELLKSGANDYLSKPYQTEEFYCRISQNVDMLNLIEDISEMANRDFLTGLHNRKFLFDAGGALFTKARHEGQPFTAAVLDIDHFKGVNDTYGHLAGDAVLRHFAVALRARFRQCEVVARYGGEEFCVLCVGADADKASELFEVFREDIALRPASFEGHKIPFTVSIGVSDANTGTLDSLVQAADSLLYRAKQLGRNRVATR